MSLNTHLIFLASAWLGYALIHSVLASLRVKSWCRDHFPGAFKAYRLGFNLVSLALLIPPVWLLYSYPGDVLWQWPAPLAWLADAMALAAIGAFILGARMYDTSEFLGLRQLRQNQVELDDQAPMSLSWAHRYVRHPWYFLALVVIWSREMNAALLVSATILTLYLIVGSSLEDRKLSACYGEQYRAYRRLVAGLLPLPWRFINRRQASEILAMGKNPSAGETQ